ncbi:MAG: GEVED domain-containing protein, partial [Crocinitomicaceae bacterium]
MILTSAALLFAVGNYSYAQYCASSAIYTGDEVITNVTLGSINNSSICGATAPGAGSAANLYANFTGLAAPNMTVGNSYPMSVTVGTCNGYYGTYTNVYIDWNGDQDFLDANETVYTGAYTAAAATMTFNVVVPAGAT